MKYTQDRSDFDYNVCGYLRSLIALEGLTEPEACDVLGVPVAMLDSPGFPELLKPEDVPPSVK